MTTAVDARSLNWRFLVPGEPPGMLLLPVADELVPEAVIPERSSAALAAALDGTEYPAIAAPDLTGWARLNEREEATALLARLGWALRRGGWLYIGFANRRYPPHLRSQGAVSLPDAVRTLRGAGVPRLRTYLTFPDQRAPAYVVSVERPDQLQHFLRRMAFPHVDAETRRPRLRQRTVRAMRRVALVTPHRVRVTLAPAFALVGRKA